MVQGQRDGTGKDRAVPFAYGPVFFIWQYKATVLPVLFNKDLLVPFQYQTQNILSTHWKSHIQL